MENQRLFSELDRSHTDEPATGDVRDDLREVFDPDDEDEHQDEGEGSGEPARV